MGIFDINDNFTNKLNNNIENIYTGYDDIVAEFTEAGIKDTITTLLKEIEMFTKSLGIYNDVHVEDVILTHAVLDYYSDVSRLKQFHKITTINKIKNRCRSRI